MWALVHKECWAPKNWCFPIVVLEKTLESPLDCKEIKPVNPKGDQPWIFIGRTLAEAETPIFWPPNAKSQLIRRDLDSGKDWRQKEKQAGEMRWLDMVSNSMEIILSKLVEIVVNREFWCAQSMRLPRIRHNLVTEEQQQYWLCHNKNTRCQFYLGVVRGHQRADTLKP